jgi:hypothetical protein
LFTRNSMHTFNIFKSHFKSSQVDFLYSCKIWGVHGDVYEESRLLGSGAVWLWLEPTFRRNVSPACSGRMNRDENTVNRWLQLSALDSCCSHLLSVFSSRFTCPEDGGDTFLRNVGSNHNYTIPDPRRRLSSYTLLYTSFQFALFSCFRRYYLSHCRC